MSLPRFSVQLLTIAIFFISSISVTAQTSKIAIVSLEDTTLINQHVGFTVFSNFTDTLQLHLPVRQYVEQRLFRYLSTNYEVSFLNLPDSVYTSRKSIYSAWSGLSKEVKRWMTNLKDQYNLIIFVNNIDIPREMNFIAPPKTSGVYSRGRVFGCFTSISFFAYRTSNLNELEYYNLGGKIVSELKDVSIPEDKRSFTPEALELIKAGLLKHLDSRIVHFLSKTFLVSQQDMDNISGPK